jgi:hypothetical protein
VKQLDIVNQLIEWAAKYSTPVFVLLACGAVLIYILRLVVEKTVEAEFKVRNKRLELLLERRSGFEEKVLLNQYMAVTELQLNLSKIGADINRMHSGIEVEGLFNGREIVPLSEVYIELQAKRFLFRNRFHDILLKEANNLLSLARAANSDEVEMFAREFLQLNEQFGEEMNRVFGIEQIGWNESQEF